MKRKTRIVGAVLEDLADDLSHLVGKFIDAPPPTRFETGHDLATYICRRIPNVAAEPPICPTVTAFSELRVQLAQFTGRAETAIRSDTLLDEILDRRGDWRRLAAFLNTRLPHKPWGHLGLLFIMAMIFQCTFLATYKDLRDSFPGIFPVSIFLSAIETAVLGALAQFLTMRRPPHLQTVGDLACHLALRPDQRRPKGGWSASEVRQLMRYSIARSLGESVSSIKLRKEYTRWA